MTPEQELATLEEGLKPLTNGAFLLMMNNFISAETILLQTSARNTVAVEGMAMAAKEFTIEIFNLIEVWRRVHQGGKGLTRADVHQAFKTALLDNNSNPFFSVYSGLLNPLIMSGRIAWDTADVFSAAGEEDTYHACMTRMYEIFPMIVYCLWSGVEHKTVVEAQRIAMTKALECSIIMRASVNEFIRST